VVADPPKPEPQPVEDTRPKPVPKSAFDVAEDYLRLFQEGPRPEKQLDVETADACQRRNNASPDRPLYSYYAWKITPQEVTPGENKVTFQGQAEVLRRYSPLKHKDWPERRFDWGASTGGTAKFTLELVRDDDKGWRVDDFRFQKRPPQAGAVKSREQWLEQVRSEVGDKLLQHYDVKEMEAKLGLKAWVFYYVGDGVQLRAQIDHVGRMEKGKKESSSHNGLELRGVPEGRVCLLIFQDVRRDDPTRLNESLVMKMSHNSRTGFDVPYLWYGWKGVSFEERTFDDKLVIEKEVRILEVEATETEHVKGEQPRTVRLTLYATLLPPK